MDREKELSAVLASTDTIRRDLAADKGLVKHSGVVVDREFHECLAAGSYCMRYTPLPEDIGSGFQCIRIGEATS